MSRTVRSAILALLAAALFAPVAEAAVYRGGGRGLKVEFRVVGKKIVEAKVVTRLRCIERPRKRHYRRLGVEMASERSPIEIWRGGRFLEPSGPEAPEEPGYSEDELLKGRVQPGKITGRFAYLQVHNTRHREEECRTGPFNHAWFLRSNDEVSFRAHRANRPAHRGG